MKHPTENDILHSWEKNANNWQHLIDQGSIESRSVTNEAVINVLSTLPIRRLLDLGCGEGWLVRRMQQYGLDCRGIDGSAALVGMASASGGPFYQCMSFGEIIAGRTIEGSPFDAIVLNFVLFGKDSTPKLLQSLHPHLNTPGFIIIQSLHPDAGHAFEPSHWKPNVWEGLPDHFSDPYPYYHRSMSDWQLMFRECQLDILRQQEQLHPRTKRPTSIIFVLSPAAQE